MKKLLAVLLALALCAGLSACGHFVNIMPGTEPVVPGSTPDPAQATEDTFEDTPLMDFIGWSEFASSYYSDTPIALSRRDDGEGAFASPVFDRASIIAACDALRSMTVTGRAGDAGEGGETTFTFTLENGDELAVSFRDGRLRLNAGEYTVSGGEALWDILFPCYDEGFDLFDLYFSEDVRAFADGFGTDTPVSVGRRMNGGATLTSKDPQAVQQVFDILKNAKVSRVEESPDQNIDLTQTTDYVFTMADASTKTFSFAGPCLAVTVSADYGTVYYWLEGADDLPYVTVVPESTLPTFEGGILATMREDIGQAADAADGLLGDITVDGVYVDYTIDGQTGYLTLDGDNAINFVRRVASISASSELVAAEGDPITVFVTLSDQSGPILCFFGDTVQQMVGMNYPCDAGAMANLRSYILELAKDETNIADFAGETTG